MDELEKTKNNIIEAIEVTVERGHNWRGGGRPLGSKDGEIDLEEEFSDLVRPSLRYLKEVIKGKETDPNRVRLGACKSLLLYEINKRKKVEKVEKKAEDSKQLGSTGSSYEEEIKKRQKGAGNV